MDSAMHIHASVLPQTLLPSRLPYLCNVFSCGFVCILYLDEALLTKNPSFLTNCSCFCFPGESHGFLWVGSSFLREILGSLGDERGESQRRISLHPHPRMKATEFAFSWYSHFNTKEKYLLVLKGLGTPCDCYFATDTFQRPFMSTLLFGILDRKCQYGLSLSFCERIYPGWSSQPGAQVPMTRKLEKLESWAEMYWSWALWDRGRPLAYGMTERNRSRCLNWISFSATHSGCLRYQHSLECQTKLNPSPGLGCLVACMTPKQARYLIPPNCRYLLCEILVVCTATKWEHWRTH